jgi:hypothetical protein
MKEDLDFTELLNAVERTQRGYRKPLPGVDASLKQPRENQSRDDSPQPGSEAEAPGD